MLHAYCVRRAGEPGPAPGLTGVGGAQVELREAEGLGLWISAAAAGGPSVERLREHDRVVRAALRSATPLPIRYGAPLAHEEAAREMLRERREGLLAGLERVAGRVELGIRVAWEPPAAEGEEGGAPPEEAGPGRAYLERRRRERIAAERRHGAAEALLREVDGYFADLRVESELRVLAEAGVAGTLAHLVHRGELMRYRDRMERARREFLPSELRPSGPWAPYSFV